MCLKNISVCLVLCSGGVRRAAIPELCGTEPGRDTGRIELCGRGRDTGRIELCGRGRDTGRLELCGRGHDTGCLELCGGRGDTCYCS